MSVHRFARYKVTDKATGESRYLTAAELAALPSRRAEKKYHWPPVPERLDRNMTIKLIRDALKKRSGKQWSVTGGRGTAWGWIRIAAPPARSIYDSEGKLLPEGKREYGYMSPADQAELTRLLGLAHPVHHQGESIAASSGHYREYIDRARGLEPTVIGQQYWD